MKPQITRIISIFCVLFISAVNLNIVAQTEGNISSRPQVGTSVQYQIKRSEMDGAGFKKVWESSLKISVVQQEKKDKKSYYWVELTVPIPEDKTSEGVNPPSPPFDKGGMGGFRVIKFLVSEEGELLKDKLILKEGNLPAIEADLIRWAKRLEITQDELFQELVGKFLIIPFTPPAGEGFAESVNVSVNQGSQTFDSQRYLVEDAGKKTATKLWFASEVPFPSVAKILIFDDSAQGTQTQIKLVNYETKGAVSVIKENPTRLNFKEGPKK